MGWQSSQDAETAASHSRRWAPRHWFLIDRVLRSASPPAAAPPWCSLLPPPTRMLVGPAPPPPPPRPPSDARLPSCELLCRVPPGRSPSSQIALLAGQRTAVRAQAQPLPSRRLRPLDRMQL